MCIFHLVKPIPPTIISHPKNISVGGPEQWIDFWCNATGTPAPTYSWWHDDRWIALETDSPKVSLVAMKTGFIRCEVKNEAGTDSATAYITVKRMILLKLSSFNVFFVRYCVEISNYLIYC